MRHFDTLSEALHTLNKEGYTFDFNLLGDGLQCKSLNQNFGLNDFTVEKIYRFEGNSNPDDSSILYVITTGNGIKGTLLDAFGAYSGEIPPALLAKLSIHE